jgi:hypothetical protein
MFYTQCGHSYLGVYEYDINIEQYWQRRTKSITPALHKQVREAVDRIVQMGFIQEQLEPTPTSSLMIIVAKQVELSIFHCSYWIQPAYQTKTLLIDYNWINRRMNQWLNSFTFSTPLLTPSFKIRFLKCTLIFIKP